MDEADAILRERGTGRSSDTEKTIVPAFLAEMDGIQESGAFVILATNKPETLDAAVTRRGRIDRKIEIGRPDFDGIKEIFGIYFASAPLQKGLNPDFLSAYCAEGMALSPTFRANMSGALISNVVERTKILAMRRDVDAGGKFTGIAKSDAEVAILEVAASL